MPQITEVKLSSCGLQKNCYGIAELQSNISLKSCGIAIAEVFPLSCRIAVADSKKKLRVPTSAIYTEGLMEDNEHSDAGAKLFV
jgi:hypothetical protein